MKMSIKMNWRRIFILSMVIVLVASMFLVSRERKLTREYIEAYKAAKEWEEEYLLWSEAYMYILRDMAFILNDMSVEEIEVKFNDMLDEVEKGDTEELLRLQEEAKGMFAKMLDEKHPEDYPAEWVEENLALYQFRMDTAMQFYEKDRCLAIEAEGKKCFDINAYFNFRHSWVGRKIYAQVMYEIFDMFNINYFEHREVLDPEYKSLPHYVEIENK